MRCQNTIGVLLVVVAMGVPAAWAQQKKPESKPAATTKVEGQITQLDLSPGQGMPTLTVKTAEGKEYTVVFGPLADLKRQGFNPKVGDKVSVTGANCCETQGKTMIHSSEIVLSGKTFRTPMAPPVQGMGMQGGQGAGRGPGMGMDMPGGCCAQQGGMASGAGMGTFEGCCAQGGSPAPKPAPKSPSR